MMKITFEANLPIRNKKFVGALMTALILLSASTVDWEVRHWGEMT